MSIFADLNVEHAQLVLILFHSLNFMQKKSVLLVTGSGAVRCSEAVKTPMKDSQLLHLSRLLLLLEYMMKHLYGAPPALLEQVSKLTHSGDLNIITIKSIEYYFPFIIILISFFIFIFILYIFIYIIVFFNGVTKSTRY